MKAVILAGGLPSAIIPDNEKMPKPMAEIGTQPILWHIMKLYAHYGVKDFIVCGGYKVEMIKEYFMNFYIYHSDITVDLETNEVILHNKVTEDWKVTVVDTGTNTSVIERFWKIKNLLADEKMFAAAYGDCVSNINVEKLKSLHVSGGKLMTLAVAKPVGRNRVLPIANGSFSNVYGKEHMEADDWVNAYNMICSIDVFEHLPKFGSMDQMIDLLCEKDEVVPYFHKGFWSSMETVHDRDVLNGMWESGDAPWMVWENIR